MGGIGEIQQIAAKWALFRRHNGLRLAFSQPKGGLTVTRVFPGYVAWPTWSVAPGYVEVGLRPTGTTVLNLG